MGLTIFAAIEPAVFAMTAAGPPPRVSSPAAPGGVLAPVGPGDASGSRQPAAVRARVAPASLKILEKQIDARIVLDDPWTLFDGDGESRFGSNGPARIRVGLPADMPIAGVGVYGQATGTLVVFGETDAGLTPIKGLEQRLTGLSLRWNRFDAEGAAHVRALVLEWRPEGPGPGIRELELWGLVSEAPRISTDSMADQLLIGLPRGAVETVAEPREQVISTPVLGVGGGAAFHLDLDRDARAFGRAFLVYELEGLSHWSSVVRRINGNSVQGGFGVLRGSHGGLQVEEIAPSWLQSGRNEIRFMPADENDPVGYRVRALRVVGVTGGSVSSSTPAAPPSTIAGRLSDGDPTTGLSTQEFAGGAVYDVPFERASQLDSLSIRLTAPLDGAVSVQPIRAGNAQERDKMLVKLTGLPADEWVTLPIRGPGAETSADGVRLRFRGPKESHGSVSEVRVVASPTPTSGRPEVAVTFPTHGECSDGRAYIRGFVNPAWNGAGAPALSIDGVLKPKAIAPDGAFGIEVPMGAEAARTARQVVVATRFPGGDDASRTVTIGPCAPKAKTPPAGAPVADEGAPFGQVVKVGESASLNFAGARIDIPAGALTEDTRITIRPVTGNEVPASDETLTNVTVDGRAYRFGPHGLKFAKAVAITIPYDRARFPGGLAEDDMGVFYFDNEAKHWRQVQTESGRAGAQTLTASSTHFTDFIAATITSPDHPTADSFNPTSIKDIKLADPASRVDLIAPPEASPDGAAHLSYPLWVPPGRQGMQPSLNATYNSDGGNGLYGVGWDVPISSIEVDTRFGVPLYDGHETYSIDGELLVADPNGSTLTKTLFHRRAEGRFDTIIRTGPGPDEKADTNNKIGIGKAYRWEVVDKKGIHFIYGESFDARGSINGGMVYRWYLERMEDPFGNTVTYSYNKIVSPLPDGSGASPATAIPPSPSGAGGDPGGGTGGSDPGGDNTGGSTTLNFAVASVPPMAVEVYPKEIFYTHGKDNQFAHYKIIFELNNNDNPLEGPGIQNTDDAAVRPDTILSARGGTMAAIRRRIVNIKVAETGGLIDNQTIYRRYNFVYETGAFGKSVLQRIAVYAADDDPVALPREFYRHSFEYTKLPTTGTAGTPAFVTEEWDGAPTKPLSVMESQSVMGSVGGGWSLAACPILHLFGGVSVTPPDISDLPIPVPDVFPHFNQDVTRGEFLDLNGDGLPDFIQGSFSSPAVVRLNKGPQEKAFTSAPLPAGSPFLQVGHSQKYSFGVTPFSVHVAFEAGKATLADDRSWASSNTDQLFADMDGDGFIDNVQSSSGGINVQPLYRPQVDCCSNPLGTDCRACPGGPGGARTWAAGTAATPIMPDDIKALQLSNFVLADPTIRWRAPYAGTILVSGPITRLAVAPPDPALPDVPDDGVRVFIEHFPRPSTTKPTERWQHDLLDTTPCYPTLLPVNGCDPGSPGISMTVEPGDRIYFRTDSVNRIDADDVSWIPHVQYTTICDHNGGNCHPINSSSTQEPPANTVSASLLEPAGPLAYTFDFSDDFRVAGGAPSTWTSASLGSTQIAISGILRKTKKTPDAIKVAILSTQGSGIPQMVGELTLPAGWRTSSSGTGAAEVFQPDFIGDLQVDFNAPATYTIESGTRLVFQISSETPFDPAALEWKPQVEYKNFCRTPTTVKDPTDDPTKGKCYAVPSSCLSTPDQLGECHLEGDPDPDAKVSASLVLQPVAPSYQMPGWSNEDPPVNFVAPANGKVFLSLAGFVNTRGVKSARAVVQSPNATGSPLVVDIRSGVATVNDPIVFPLFPEGMNLQFPGAPIAIDVVAG